MVTAWIWLDLLVDGCAVALWSIHGRATARLNTSVIARLCYSEEAADPVTGQPTSYFRMIVILTLTPIFTIILGRSLSCGILKLPR
jgi:hypothetical protein